MAEAAQVEEASTEAPEIQGSLESRLSPEQIAQLDEMNARVFGGTEPEPFPGSGSSDADKPVQTPVPPSPKTPEPVVSDEFTPPDDDAPPVASTTEEKAPAEFPEGKTLFPDEAIDKLRTEKSKGDIKGLREHYENAVKTLKERETQLAELQKKGGGDTESLAIIEDLKTRNAQLSAIVEQKSIQDHPWYQQTFVHPRQRALAAAEKAMDLAAIDNPKQALDKALGLDGRERIAAFDQIFGEIESSMLRARLEKSVAEIDEIDEKKTAFLADREGNSAKMLAEQRAQHHQQLQQQESFVKDGINRTIDHLAKKSAFFRKSGKPGYEKWDAAFDEDRSLMEELALRNEDPLKLISTVALGVRAGRILAAYDRVRTQLAERDKTIAEMRGSRPSLNGDKVQAGERQETAIDPNEDLVTASRRAITEVTSGY